MSDSVRLRSYIDPEEAIVVQSALQAAGVDVILFNDRILTSLSYLRVAVGGFALHVPASQKAEAMEAIAEIESRQTDEPIGADTPCANCGGRNFRRERSLRWTIIAFFVGTGLAAQSRRSRCVACGETVNYDERPPTIRLFFFLSSIAILAFIAWSWEEQLYYVFLG